MWIIRFENKRGLSFLPADIHRALFCGKMVSVSGLDLLEGSDWCQAHDVAGIKWYKINTGSFKGSQVVVNNTNGQVEILSTRNCSLLEESSNGMPSISEFPDLEILDLHKSSHLRELNSSICDLVRLRKLILTRCCALERLPPLLGALKNLREVCRMGRYLLHVRSRPTILTSPSFLV